MSPATVGALVFACAFGGVLGGMGLARIVPSECLAGESKDSVRIGIGLVATMAALVLGLVTASAKQSFDDVDRTVRNVAVDVLTLDGVLAHFGPEAREVREHLKAVVAGRVAAVWPREGANGAVSPGEAAALGERLAFEVRGLATADDRQVRLKARATDLTESLLEVRFRFVGRVGSSVQAPFLVIIVFWITLTFASFGVFAPRNALVAAVLLLCAVSVAAAVFLVLELDGPFDGLVRVSPEPLSAALSFIGR